MNSHLRVQTEGIKARRYGYDPEEEDMGIFIIVIVIYQYCIKYSIQWWRSWKESIYNLSAMASGQIITNRVILYSDRGHTNFCASFKSILLLS